MFKIISWTEFYYGYEMMIMQKFNKIFKKS